MSSRRLAPGMLNLFGLFGNEVDHARARDMSLRLVRVQIATVTVIGLAILAGISHYDARAALPMVLAELGYVVSVALSLRVGRPHIGMIVSWTFAQAMMLTAIVVAGPPHTYVWPAAAMSLLFIGVIWTRVTTAMATATTVLMLVSVALAVDGHAVTANPLLLAPAVLLLLILGDFSATLRDVDFDSRGHILTDTLTGLTNRLAMQRRSAAIEADGGGGAVVVFDLDHFKQINDIHGHPVGDGVLRGAAERMSEALGDAGTLHRYGGEEFVAILPGAGAEEGLRVAERVREAIAARPIGGLSISTSAGVAAAAAGNFDGGELFRSADAAMYSAKEAGRDRVVLAPELVAAPRDALPPGDSADTIGAVPIGTVTAAPRTASTFGPSRWLIPTVVQRDQLLAVTAGFNPLRLRATNLALLALGLGMGATYGWLPAAVLLVHALALDPAVRPSRRLLEDGARGGEALPLLEAMVSMALIALAITLAQVAALSMLALLAVPAIAASAAYPRIAGLLLVGEGLLLIAAAALVTDLSAVAENPIIATLPLALLASACMIGASVGHSAVDHRAAAIIDPLTGLLNRAALDLRLPDITETAATRRTPVTVIVGDLDHFKQINDTYGHRAGDDVLTAAAERIREEVRVADSVYRVGGEEFVIVLPATRTTEGVQVAERIREAISANPVRGKNITISLGVAGSAGRSFRYSEAFGRADGALLEAKCSGRNRVCTAAPMLRSVEAA